MKALTFTSTRPFVRLRGDLSTGVGIVLCLGLLFVSGIATGARGPLALRQGPSSGSGGPFGFGSGQASGQASGSGGCVPGHSYLPACDLNRDNAIDIVDIMLVASKWGRSGTWTSDNWSLTGNPNTTPGTNFLGTTDNVSLEMRVNNQGALRMEPTTGTPNLIGGYGGNSIAGGVVGATIGGGGQTGAINQASADFVTVGGGEGNSAMGFAATIGGGETNAALGFAATVGGGANNVAGNVAGNANFATVGGGIANTASNEHATVGGGISNTASGKRATVPGGNENTAAGDYSFAAGRRAKANSDGCFVWGDSTDADVACNSNNCWVARASGGVYFYTNAGLTSGMYLSVGGSSWNAVSARERKENFASVDVQELVARLAEVPITTWNYRSQDSAVRHIGPMAEDFNALIDGLGGEGEDYINTLDADGVALAAIQGLYQLVQEQAAQIAALQQQNADLEARLAALEQAIGTERR